MGLLVVIMTSSKVHGALLLANSFWGIGAVVGALGLPATNPLAFCMVRQFLAGLLLLLGGAGTASFASIKVHWKRFLILGLALFGSQADYLLGVILAGPVTASVWQPIQPIFTAAICMILGWEPAIFQRIIGVLIAFMGCVMMVLLLSKHDQDKSKGRGAFWFVLVMLGKK